MLRTFCFSVVILRTFLIGIAATALAVSANALTLGASHGGAVLGSFLDVTFDARPDPGQELDAACIAAHVKVGDARVPEGRVELTASQSSPRATGLLRVRVNTPVNEPVVVVALEAGCSGRVSRTYTFLTELPAEPVVASRPAGDESYDSALLKSGALAPIALAPSGSKPKDSWTGTAADVGRRTRARPATTSSRRSASVSAAPAAASSVRGAAALSAEKVVSVSPGARLVMEPLDLWLETPPVLKLAREPMQLTSPAADDAARNRAAGTWRALSMSAEEVIQLEARDAQAAAETAKLQARLRSEQAAATELRQRTEVAERAVSERYSAALVYGLLAALALALIALGWQTRRKRQQLSGEWQQSVALSSEQVSSAGRTGPATVWPQSETNEGNAAEMADAEDSASAPVPTPAAPTGLSNQQTAPVALQSVGDPAQALLVEGSDEQQSAPRARDIEHPEELFDILQQAEFFISIGEHEQAIDALRRHIRQHPASSPIAHLELLRLYHTLGRVAAFEELRGHFEERFNARVPPFAAFQRGGRSLEDYPEDLQRIETLWASPEVMEVIDELMFRRAPSEDLARFDLPAYEDLLLLLAIVQTTAAAERTGTGARVSAGLPARGREAAAIKPAQSLDSMAGDLALEPSARIPVDDGPPSGFMRPDVSLDPDAGAAAPRLGRDDRLHGN